MNILPTFASLIDYPAMKNSLIPRIKRICLGTSLLNVGHASAVFVRSFNCIVLSASVALIARVSVTFMSGVTVTLNHCNVSLHGLKRGPLVYTQQLLLLCNYIGRFA